MMFDQDQAYHGTTQAGKKHIILKGFWRVTKLRFGDKAPQNWWLYDGRILKKKGETEQDFDDLTVREQLVIQTSEPVEYAVYYVPGKDVDVY